MFHELSVACQATILGVRQLRNNTGFIMPILPWPESDLLNMVMQSLFCASAWLNTEPRRGKARSYESRKRFTKAQLLPFHWELGGIVCIKSQIVDADGLLTNAYDNRRCSSEAKHNTNIRCPYSGALVVSNLPSLL